MKTLDEMVQETREKVAANVLKNRPTLTPYELEILLHYYSSCSDFPRWQAPAFHETREGLRRRDLLYADQSHFGIAPRGRAYIEHLLRQPLPVCKWVCE